MKKHTFILFLIAGLIIISSCEEFERANPYDENGNCYTINKGSEASVTDQDIVITFNFDKITEDNPVLHTGIRYLIADNWNYENQNIRSEFSESNYHYTNFYTLQGKPNTGEQNVRINHLPPGTEIYYQSFLKYDDSDSRLFYGDVKTIKKEPTEIIWSEIYTNLPSGISDGDETQLSSNNIVIVNNNIFSIFKTQEYNVNTNSYDDFLYLLKYNQSSERWENLNTFKQENEVYFGFVNCESHIVCFYVNHDDYSNSVYYYNEYNPKTNKWSEKQVLPDDLEASFDGSQTFWKTNTFVVDSTLYVFREGDYLSTYHPGIGWSGSILQESELRDIIAESYYVSVNSQLYLFKESEFNNDEYFVYKWQPNKPLECLNDNPEFPQGIKNYMILNNNLYLACEYYIRKHTSNDLSGPDIVSFLPSPDRFGGGDNWEEIEKFWDPAGEDFDYFTQRALFKLNLNTGSLSDNPLLIAPQARNNGGIYPDPYKSPDGSHYFSGLLELGLYNWHGYHSWNQTRYLGSIDNSIIMFYPRLDVESSEEITEIKWDDVYQLDLESVLKKND